MTQKALGDQRHGDHFANFLLLRICKTTIQKINDVKKFASVSAIFSADSQPY